jgi:predicted outer membrane protein
MSNARLAIVLFVAPGALAACSHEEPIPVRTAVPTSRSVSASQMAYAIERLPQPDRDFVKRAAAANLAAIRFGELATIKGFSLEARSLGREMVDTHTQLSDQLRSSARNQGVTLPMAQLTLSQQRMYDRLSALSGPSFDSAFARAVMQLQAEAIANFQTEATDGKLSELAMLANRALPLINQRVRTVQNQLQRM